jgi:hypothetical protein
MKAIIYKILPPKQSIYGQTYHRIEFTLADGSFAVTDIVEGYRNYNKWRAILDAPEGTEVKGLIKRKEGLINADCNPQIVWYPKDILTKKSKRVHNKV